MIKIPGMLIVGATGKNVGKTEFACSLIKKFRSQCGLIGIKVTILKDDKNKPAKNGHESGVKSYCITEETNRLIKKDTGKMLAAGASKVYWLRTYRRHLEEGISELLNIVGKNTISICESNSLRNIIEPGLFIMVKDYDSENSKASAKEVSQYVDRFVYSDGKKFNIDLDEIILTDVRWINIMKATAIILAGGESTRMGQDKSMLQIVGKPAIKYIFDQIRPYFNQILISSDNLSEYSFLSVDIVPDRITGRGPLMGIASALEASANEVNFVIACDIPKVDIDLVRMMVRESREFDAVIPKTGPLWYEPLFAVYKKSTLTIIEKLIASGNNRVIDIYEHCKVKYVDLPFDQQPKNLNTMKDYSEFMRKESSDKF
jgi:molybdopterin-guanine dinucleotide biosynthesis protein A